MWYVWEYGNVCVGIWCMYVWEYVCMYVWEYGNVCMGIWECGVYGNLGMYYGNMGMWYVWEFGNVLWEYGNVRTTVLIFLQQQNLFFQLISMCLHRPCLIYLQIKLFIIDNLLRPAPWPYQYWGHRKYQKSWGRTVCLLYWDKNFYFYFNNNFNHYYFLFSFQMQR